ncbi:MAG: uncharacterized protein A8A55_1078 [Amphiamblys sp. WSBS2006]|nr:MAG: uncharacterized protein A8A55_1078 [Amphiamblys sp. WSBS2006]
MESSIELQVEKTAIRRKFLEEALSEKRKEINRAVFDNREVIARLYRFLDGVGAGEKEDAPQAECVEQKKTTAHPSELYFELYEAVLNDDVVACAFKLKKWSTEVEEREYGECLGLFWHTVMEHKKDRDCDCDTACGAILWEVLCERARSKATHPGGVQEFVEQVFSRVRKERHTENICTGMKHTGD